MNKLIDLNLLRQFKTNLDRKITKLDEEQDKKVEAALEEVNGRVEDLSANLPFAFGVDDAGNYGYIKEGADSVTPFKSLLNLKVWNPGNIALSEQQSASYTFSKPEGVTEIIIIYTVSSPYSGPTISYTKNCIKNERGILGWSQGQANYYGATTYATSVQTIYDVGNIVFTIRSLVPSGNSLTSRCGVAVLY